MQPPRIKSFSRESVPGAPAFMEQVFLLLNEALSQISGALSRRLTRNENMYASEKMGCEFTTPATGVPTLTIKWDVVSKPKHVDVTGLRRSDSAAITSAWSCTYDLTSTGNIQLSFQGLAASTTYRCNVRWE